MGRRQSYTRPNAFDNLIGKPSRWRIIRWRIERGLEVKQLCMNMIPPSTRSSLSQLETGYRALTLSMMTRCARAMGMKRLEFVMLSSPNDETWEIEETCADAWLQVGRPADFATLLDIEMRAFTKAKATMPEEFLKAHKDRRNK